MLRKFLQIAASVLLLACGAGADVFTNVPEAAGYQLVHTLPIPVNQGSYNTNAIPYTANSAAAFPTGTFTRVAYYLELSGSTDPTRKNGYVFVSFDRPPALPNGNSVGVPSNGPNGTKIVTNTTVTNMNVVSNVQGVITGTGLPGGKIEFWPSNYAPGANGVYDYDDDQFNSSNGYGSMQVHNVAAGQTLIAYNSWGNNNVGDVGMGPNPGAGDPDWTFSNSASAYTVRTLQVLVKPAANLVPIVNPSFEDDAIGGPNAPLYQPRATAPNGWTYSGTADQGLIAPDAGEPNPFYNGTTTGYSGAKAHFSYTLTNAGVPTLSQTLSATLQANTTYTLSVQIGNRNNGDTWGGHHIALMTNAGVLVGEWVGANNDLTPDGTFGRSARKFTTGANPPGLGQPLRIVIEQPNLNATGRYLDIDDAVLTADPAPVRPVGTPIDVMIVAGQSNTQGWQANVAALSTGNRHYADAPSPNAFIAYKQNAYGQPLYISGSLGQLSSLGAGFAGQFDGFGPELSTGTDLAGRVANKVAVIKFASGGAGLNAHFKKSANNLYPLLIAQVNSGLAELTAQGFAPTLKGFFWLQGETDALDNTAAELYGANITQFVSDLRSDLVAPALKVVLTEINPNMPALQNQPGVTRVNQGMRNLSTSDANVKFVPTADITSGFADSIHYTADQTVAIGQRWANAYQAPPPQLPGQAVFERVPEAGDEGFQVLYELNIPTEAAYQGTVQIPYSVDNSLTVPAFDRVAYYLELTNPDGTSRWVYVSMDAFTNNAKQLGLPHSIFNPVKHQRLVDNMNVFSNVPGVVTGTSLDGGALEMWPSGYQPGQEAFFYAGSGGVYDWSDSGGSATAAGYGSFQIHNPLARQVIFAYNRWGQSDSTADDIGIGNQPVNQPDYTFAGNAGTYAARKLVILVRPGTHVTFSAAPKNHALIPRNLATSMATVPFAGTEAEGGYGSAILRIYRNGVFQSEQVQALTYASTAPFSFNPQIPAELASYDFEVLIEKAGQRRLVRRVTDVVAGDAYLFYGQSNGEAGFTFSGNNTTSNGYAGPWVRTFGQNADSGNATRNNLSWVPANGDGAGSGYVDPGAVGQWAIVVGGKIVADHQIPVALVNGSRGGYSMPQLQKDDAQPDNLDDDATRARTYNRLRYRAIQGGLAAKARAMFYYQGESDVNDAQAHANGFAALYADWQTDYPGLQHFYEIQLHVGCGVSQDNVLLREVQRAFGDVYPKTSVMATNGLNAHDGCHYRFIDGYEILGLNHFRQVSRDLYSGPAGANIDALNPASVAFTDETHTRVRVVMRDPGATIAFPTAALADFALTGTSAQITGRSVSGNSFTLDLDGSATGSPVLEYRGHVGSGAWVTNGNGVGLLAFAEPLGPFGPVVTITLPAASQEATVGSTLNIVATAANSPSGPATRMVFLVNGVPQFETTGNTLNTTWQVPTNGAHLLSVVAYDAANGSGADSLSILAGLGATPGGVSTGLRIWFKAETGVTKDTAGLVLAWQDQSGNNNHASQAMSANQPKFTDNAFGIGAGVQFDGNDYLTSATGMPTGSYTKIVRFKAVGTGTVHNLISSDVAGNAGARDHAFFVPNLYPTIYHSGSTLGSNQPVASGASVVAACTFDAANNEAKVYVDGVLRASGFLDGPNTIASFQLGAFAASAFLAGGLAEVIVYDHVLSNPDRAAVFAYLDDKYRTPFGLWLKSYYGQGGSPTADTDGDGLSTAVEYALGLNPTVADSASTRLPQVTRFGNMIEVTYQRAADHPDVITRLESSPDLTTWTPASESSLGVTGNVETRRHTATIPPGATRWFYRLHVTLP